MATFMTALVTSRLGVEDIAVLLHAAGYTITGFDVDRTIYLRPERRSLSVDGRVFFEDHKDLRDENGQCDPNGTPQIRQAGVLSHAKMTDYVDETGYEGPGTTVLLGCGGNAEAILTRVLERSGGMLHDDLSSEGWWTVDPVVDVTPEQRKNAGADLVTLAAMAAMRRTAAATGLDLEFAPASPDGLRAETIREKVRWHVKLEDAPTPGLR